MYTVNNLGRCSVSSYLQKSVKQTFTSPHLPLNVVD